MGVGERGGGRVRVGGYGGAKVKSPKQFLVMAENERCAVRLGIQYTHGTSVVQYT